MEAGRGEAVEHEVHAADAEHGHAGVAVVAGEGVALEEVMLFLGELAAGEAVGPAFLIVSEVASGRVWVSRRCCQALTRKPQVPAAGSQTRSPGRGFEHLDHHADDVARGAELAVGAGGIEFARGDIRRGRPARPGSGRRCPCRRWRGRLR